MSVTIIHVNTLVIRGNAKRGERKPPLAIRGKTRTRPVTYCHEAVLVYDGHVIGKFVYSPDAPLDCGAKLWAQFDDSKLEIVPVVWEGEEDERAERCEYDDSDAA